MTSSVMTSGAGKLLLALSTCVLLAGCDQGAPSAKAQPKAPPPPAVTISQPLERDMIDWDEYTGRFDAVEFVEVRARVAGYLMEIAFSDGQEVKKGDKLFTIDARPFERALEQAKAPIGRTLVLE